MHFGFMNVILLHSGDQHVQPKHFDRHHKNTNKIKVCLNHSTIWIMIHHLCMYITPHTLNNSFYLLVPYTHHYFILLFSHGF